MSNSLLYQYLKEKNDNPFLRNNIIYTEGNNKITVSELYQIVNEIMEEIKANEYEISKNPYLLAHNSIYSIALFIAYLECGITSPILIDANDYIITKKNRPRTINTEMILSGESAGYEEIVGYDEEKLKEKIEEIKASNIVGEPGKGKIGIFTSGSVSEPKLVYIDEKTIIDNVKKSKNNNRYRNIYNAMPFNSVSGLFTNIFLPICAPLCEATLDVSFNIDKAKLATDVFLPRNFREIINTIDYGNIEKIFMFGETNSIEATNFLKEKMDFDNNITYVNVYGSTELGGLVSEHDIDIKDEVSIYDYDIEKDIIIYSFDNKTYYKKEKDIISILNEDEIKTMDNNLLLKAIPCGTIEDNICINNHNIGEGIINDYHTGDIFVIIENKIYVLGRKKDLISHTTLSYIDNKITDLIGRKSTAFKDGDDIYLAIKYDLSSKEATYSTTYFRSLALKAPSIIHKIRTQFPMIKEIFFVTNENFPISGKLMKSNRKQLLSHIDDYRRTNYRLAHLVDILMEHIKTTFMNNLGFIPGFSLNSFLDIRIKYGQITDNDLIKVLTPLRVFYIEKDDENQEYYICFDDSFLFERKDTINYTDEQLQEYHELAQYNLFTNKINSDNSSLLLNLKEHEYASDKKFCGKYEYSVAMGINDNGDAIMVPYDIRFVGPNSQESSYEENKETIDKIFNGTPYERCTFTVYACGIVYNNDINEDVIIIKSNGEVIGNDNKNNIINSYLYARDKGTIKYHGNRLEKQLLLKKDRH